MKEFGEWMNDMSNSIEDKSTFSRDISNINNTQHDCLAIARLQCFNESVKIVEKNETLSINGIISHYPNIKLKDILESILVRHRNALFERDYLFAFVQAQDNYSKYIKNFIEYQTFLNKEAGK